MAGLVQDDLHYERDTEPGKPKEEGSEKVLVFGKCIADAGAETHTEDKRKDHPRLNG